jgi:hemerythrin-like domain-containing protein
VEPTILLKDDHRTIEKILEALFALGRSCELGQCVNKFVVDQATNILQNFIDRYHHGKEEKCLFPILAAHGVNNEGGPIEVMLEEHILARHYIAAFKEVINNFQAGDPSMEKVIVREAGRYVRLIRGHMLKEEKILFPQILNLASKERQAIATRIKRFDQEEIGEATLKKFDQMINEFEKIFL